MRAPLVFHVLAGAIALASGYIALYAPKGRPLHRGAGIVFVATMLAMGLSGTLMALDATVLRAPAGEITVLAGLFCSYLVTTGVLAVRPPSTAVLRLERGLSGAVVMLAAAYLSLAASALGSGDGLRNGLPAPPYAIFGTFAVLCVLGDLRLFRGRRAVGMKRITRHLWRMSLALVIAATSFFLGQADEFPERYRVVPLLALPVLAVIVTLLYWLRRVRLRRVLADLTTLSAGVAR